MRSYRDATLATFFSSHRSKIKMKSVPEAFQRMPLLCFMALISLNGCSDNETPKDAPPPAQIWSSENIAFTIIEDNSKEIATYNEQYSSAIFYIQKVDTVVDEIKAIKELPNNAERVAQHRKLAALSLEGEQFGLLFEPLTNCRSAGIAADNYWDMIDRQVSPEESREAYSRYQEHAADCRGEIENPPIPTTLISGPLSQKTPPFSGCLNLISPRNIEAKQWVCPSEAIFKAQRYSNRDID